MNLLFLTKQDRLISRNIDVNILGFYATVIKVKGLTCYKTRYIPLFSTSGNVLQFRNMTVVDPLFDVFGILILAFNKVFSDVNFPRSFFYLYQNLQIFNCIRKSKGAINHLMFHWRPVANMCCMFRKRTY